MKKGVLATLGTLLWNLGTYTQYTSGTSLSLELAVSNPAAAERTYKLLLDVRQGGVTVQSETITVNGAEEFAVGAEGAKTVSTTMTSNYSDATLRVRLWDVATDESIDSVSTYIYSGYYYPYYYAPQQDDTISNMMSMMMPLIFMVIMIAMIKPMIKA